MRDTLLLALAGATYGAILALPPMIAVWFSRRTALRWQIAAIAVGVAIGYACFVAYGTYYMRNVHDVGGTFIIGFAGVGVPFALAYAAVWLWFVRRYTRRT